MDRLAAWHHHEGSDRARDGWDIRVRAARVARLQADDRIAGSDQFVPNALFRHVAEYAAPRAKHFALNTTCFAR